MKAKVVSMLLAIAMLVSLFVPTTAMAAGFSGVDDCSDMGTLYASENLEVTVQDWTGLEMGGLKEEYGYNLVDEGGAIPSLTYQIDSSVTAMELRTYEDPISLLYAYVSVDGVNFGQVPMKKEIIKSVTMDVSMIINTRWIFPLARSL